ncbi:von Willebrand factor type A domain-domain-containing protein [Lobosporangium transversale]|uniref:von Willebrand factor type A domain-domain-containing protein n=1 Tax=Lobosporangium transversale TaxID=64571 RepID=A0A1Y2H0A2_9FUNG|nr:von Willebrand factor type A domain-domain-containing protein [Lobosporangium transversale]ORZ27431.1 von Willebrand factor type A domain-domain-containing protein [Lobosporangium transversale]|eukprot:XP_021885158.1 von Willebrand factor type A domain-domain-containing protein [Lobosporangium transversale]
MQILICGLSSVGNHNKYLPLVDIKAHTEILALNSRTKLTQTFINPSNDTIPELQYTFPLYDGVSVVSFNCQIGDRLIKGQVKERFQARTEFNDAVGQGKAAVLLEQLPDASDVFTSSVGNAPPGSTILVEITFIGELKHDAEIDGTRFTIPTKIMPRYGQYPVELYTGVHVQKATGGSLQVTVDIIMPDQKPIQQIQSPSHPIAVSIGTTSIAPNATPTMSKASATLSLGRAELDKDFVIHVLAKDTGDPSAILETHPSIPNQRALMTTLVPRFQLPPEKPEIIFVCDRSGSMQGTAISLARSALNVFLKSLPVGVKFNICSFGSNYSFLWDKSQIYSQNTLDQAINYVKKMRANMGGTEMFPCIKATVEKRSQDMPLEIMLLTDGEIWNQDQLFSYLNKEVMESKMPIRVFTLGVGNGVSHALIEGVAKAGNGFSQAVGEGEKMDKKVVRMLKGALSPQITNYTLEVKYGDATEENSGKANEDDEGFEMVERVTDSLEVKLNITKEKKPISLFEKSIDLDKTPSDGDEDLPQLAPPKLLQAPHVIPPLYAFNRTTVYLLMGPGSNPRTPKSVILRGESWRGPLELEIPIQVLDTPGETIHQMAARKAIAELEQGRGWITQAKDDKDTLIKVKFGGAVFERLVEKEAVRLGIQYQISNKWCSFVGVEDTSQNRAVGSNNSTGWNISSPPAYNYVISAPSLRSQASPQAPPSQSQPDPKSIPGSGSSRSRQWSEPSGSYAEEEDEDEEMTMCHFAEVSINTSSSGVASEHHLKGLLALQTFEGSWKWESALFSCLGLKPDEVAKQLAVKDTKNNASSSRATAVATALAIKFFEKKLASEKDIWDLVVQKARLWIEEHMGAAQAVDLLNRVDELIK